MKTIKQALTIFLFALMFLSILPSQKALAHNAYFLRVAVNRDTWLYEGRVEYDEIGMARGEKNHAEATLGDFYSMKDKVSTNMSTYNQSGDGSNMIFTFPFTEVKGGAFETNNATAQDAERAYAISNVLLPSLNQMLIKINNNAPYTNEDSLAAATRKIIEASNGTKVTHNGWTLQRGGGLDHIVIEKTEGGGAQSTFLYRMKKGYRETTLQNGNPNPLYRPEYSGDALYLTVGMLAAQGLYSMEVKQLSVDALDAVKKPGALERQLSNLVISFNNGIRDLLGLHSIDELVYGQGPRMAHGYTHGVAKNAWMDVAASFNSIFMVLAWVFLGFAIIKIMYEKTLSTFSVFRQISLVNSVKNFIITGLLLGASYLFIQGLLVLNTYLSSIFATTTTFSSMGGATSANASFAQAILSSVYLFIAIYLNIIYIIRGLTIVVLIAAAPLFIVSMAFSSKGGEMFFKWLRELVANIFIQSVHAFVLGMLLTIQIGSGGLEMLVIAFALIPLTKLFKKLMLGEGGGAMEDIAGSVTSAGVGAASGLTAGLTKGKGSRPGGEMGKAGKEHSADNPTKESTKSAMSLLPEDSGKLTATPKRAETAFSTPASPESMREEGSYSAKKPPSTFGAKAKSVAGGAAIATVGAGVVGVGAVTAVGLGAIAGPQGVRTGVDIMKGGAGVMKQGGGHLGRALPDKGGSPLHLGATMRDNGNAVHHRDRSAVESLGFHDMHSSGDSARMVYNAHKLGDTDRTHLEKIQKAHRENPGSLKDRGIDNVVQGKDGLTTVFYNPIGKQAMGFTSISATPKRIIEEKSHRDSPQSRYIYDIDSVAAPKKPDSWKTA